MILIPGRLDLTGNTYGDFTVIEMLYGYKNSETSKPRTYCKCLGTDDNEYIIRADALQRGVTRHLSGVGKGRSIDISGQKFGHLVAIHPTSKRTSNGSVVWCCQCDCGNTVEVQYGSLKRDILVLADATKEVSGKNLSTIISCLSTSLLRKKKDLVIVKINQNLTCFLSTSISHHTIC